jgi:4-hydroxybenzoyl-CoA thioesterase
MNAPAPAPESRRKGMIYRRELRIEWGDCDPAGIVFYPRYLAFFDASTAYLMESAGLSRKRLGENYGIAGMPLIDVQAKFFLPSRCGDQVIIESHVADCSRSRITVEHRILRGDQLAVHGRESRVWAAAGGASTDGIRICAVPEELVNQLLNF